jgi:hypothetical protein
MGTLIEKNAIVAIIQAMNIRIKPTPIIVNTAPQKSNVPEVLKVCSPDR